MKLSDTRSWFAVLKLMYMYILDLVDMLSLYQDVIVVFLPSGSDHGNVWFV